MKHFITHFFSTLCLPTLLLLPGCGDKGSNEPTEEDLIVRMLRETSGPAIDELNAAELERLEEKEREHQHNLHQIGLFEIVDSSWEWSPRWNEFSITVVTHNHLDTPIRRVDYMARISSVEREVPWAEFDVTIFYPGGVEKGERVEKRGSPDHTGYSGKDIPEAAVVEVEVVRIYGPDPEMLYRNDLMTAFDESRLRQLRGK